MAEKRYTQDTRAPGADVIAFPSRDEDHAERLAHRPPFTAEDEWDYNDIVEAQSGLDLSHEELWINYVKNNRTGAQEEVA